MLLKIRSGNIIYLATDGNSFRIFLLLILITQQQSLAGIFIVSADLKTEALRPPMKFTGLIFQLLCGSNLNLCLLAFFIQELSQQEKHYMLQVVQMKIVTW